MLKIEEIVETIKVGGSVAGAITAICACVMFFVKPIRQWVIGKIQKVSHSDDLKKDIKDVQKALDKLEGMMEEHVRSDKEWKQEVVENFKSQTETDIVQLRNTINHIYDKNYDSKTLTIRDKESLIDLFDRYQAIGGNHNVHQKYEEMLTWELRK